VKVFLAGSEGANMGVVLRFADYPFRLCSYHYLANERTKGLDLSSTMEAVAEDDAEWIMDSGVFTLVYGAEAGTLQTEDDVLRFTERYVEDVQRWGWKHEVVEVDVQESHGTDFVWRLREEFFAKLPNRVMYVWHRQDGEAGLRELAKKGRVGVAVRESSLTMGRTLERLNEKSFLLAVARVLRECDHPSLHLLGCTTPEILRHTRAESCDSATWTNAGRYGCGSLFSGGSVPQASIYSPKWTAWRAWCEREHQVAYGKLRSHLDGALDFDMKWQYMGNLMATVISHQLPPPPGSAVRSGSCVVWRSQGLHQKLKLVPAARVQPNPWNYNVQSDDDFTKLAASLRRFGFVERPVVRTLADGTYQIINGEHRWRAAQLIGMVEIPVVDVGEMDDAQAKQLTIILNELGGSPDQVRLADLMRDIHESVSVDEMREVMPYSAGELRMYLDAVDFSFDRLSAADVRPAEEQVPDDVVVPDPPEADGTKLKKLEVTARTATRLAMVAEDPEEAIEVLLAHYFKPKEAP